MYASDKRNGERGTVLIVSLIVMVILVVVTIAALQESVTKTRSIDASGRARQAFNLAESAVDLAIMELNRRTDIAQPLTTSNDGIIGTDSWTTADDLNGNGVPDFDEPNVVAVPLSGGEYFSYVIPLGADGLDNNGDGQADDGGEQGYVRVVARARMQGSTEEREIEAVLKSVAEPTHPIFTQNFCIYAGNREQREHNYDTFNFSAGGSQHEQHWRCTNCGAERAALFTCFHNTNCVSKISDAVYRCSSCGAQRSSNFTCKHGGVNRVVKISDAVYRCSQCGASRSTSFTCNHSVNYVTGPFDAGDHSDYISGRVHINGSVAVTGDAYFADIDGDGSIYNEVNATGAVTGLAGAHSGADELIQPDIAGMDYEHLADFTIAPSGANAPSYNVANHASANEAACAGGVHTYAPSDPRHIFAGPDYRTDLGGLEQAANHTNTNFFLVDVFSSNGTATDNSRDYNISPLASGSDKIYFIDGNLVIDPCSYHTRLVNHPADGFRATIVVRGNVYVGDDIWLGSPSEPANGIVDPPPIDTYATSGLAIIAISDGESYTDVNRNNHYDEGEPILNDDGVAGYQGSIEGSGNVFYGDTNAGPVGYSQVFFFAENNFDDMSLDSNGECLPFGVQGLMSAGNQIRINRDYQGSHSKMVIKYDHRLHDGTITLPGLPRSSSATSNPVGPWAVRSWREVLNVGPWQ